MQAVTRERLAVDLIRWMPKGTYSRLIGLVARRKLPHALRANLYARFARKYSGGAYVTLYLAPTDYHRIHAPVAGTIRSWRHVPGAVFPVNPRSVRHVAGLFARNERLITYLDTPLGKIAVVKVAATGVSDITAAYDPRLRTRKTRRTRCATLQPARPVQKGEELGTFHLGSTVIVLFEKRRVALEALVKDQRVRLGEAIARRAAKAAGDQAA
jgi:phosphatidylserine decarboxylase